MTRPVTSGIDEENPLLTHWVCKDCEVLNATNRNVCLSCDKSRTSVQMNDYAEIKALRKKWGYVASGVGKYVNKPIITKSKFNNGEYP